MTTAPPPMTEAEVLAFRAGDSTIGDNLRRAVAAGHVVAHDDGTFELPGRRAINDPYLRISPRPRLPCVFLNGLMFREIYAQRMVPAGCELCFKLKASPRTLRELVALYEIACGIDCNSKWGIDLYTRHSQTIYAGLFYVSGLDAARALHRVVAAAIGGHPKLPDGVTLEIKRGCSNYEAALGPSDRYSFAPEQRAIEDYFQARYRKSGPKAEPLAAMLYGKWVPFAYQIGDDTYLDFTNGKPLYPKTVTYDP